jgi:Kdo2-lipid IVA lauroyltransferase/acyltransferase
MIDYIVYRISIFFLKALAILPLRILYFLSGFVYFFIYYFFSYRKKIVFDNLTRAFPEYSQKEIVSISKRFYHFFAKNIVENIKMFGVSEKWFNSHIWFKNPELIDELYQEGRSVIAIASHFGNWEWILGLSRSTKYKSIAIYKPLNKPYFDSFFKKHRAKFGTQLVSMRESVRVLLQNQSEGKTALTLFIADQSPVWEEIQYWTNFLNQPTAVYLGPEKLARKTNSAVVFFKMNVFGKGQYEIEVVPVSMESKIEKPYAITKKYYSFMESAILDNPEYWLWTHRRWKHTRKREEQEARSVFRFEGNVLKNH